MGTSREGVCPFAFGERLSKSLIILLEDAMLGHIIRKNAGFLNSALPTVAGFTPTDLFDIQIIDEQVQPIDFTATVDLVGITGYISQRFRAEAIAQAFREQNIPVVCGGVDVSISPHMWEPFSDHLIVGEADHIWPEFLKDFLKGTARKSYNQKEKVCLEHSKPASYKYFNKKTISNYMGAIVQSSRGCPYNCEFCDAIIYSGRKARYRGIPTILDELHQLYDLGVRFVYIGDDNFSINRQKATEILEALRAFNSTKKSRMSFITAGSIDVASDPVFLKLAVEAGLTRMFIGLETVNTAALKGVKKTVNTQKDIYESVKTIYQHGIQIVSGCMVGFDEDDISIFRKQFDFFTQLGIPNVFVYPLQALDGTPLKERMIRENRYIDLAPQIASDRSEVNTFRIATIRPKLMSLESCQKGCQWLTWELYKPDNYIGRLATFLQNYETSRIKDEINIQRSINLHALQLFGRVMFYGLFRSTTEEKRVFWKLIKLALSTSHPLGWEFAIGAFLFILDARLRIMGEFPDIGSVEYPKEDVQLGQPERQDTAPESHL